jgi:high-affinity nickel-transport protein
MLTVLAGWLLGIVVGLRHALEPDHLAAVSTLVALERRSARAALLGASWGLGHAGAILAAGGALVLLQAGLPARLGDLAELCVAAVLIALGARSLIASVREAREGGQSAHHHGGLAHVHAGPAGHLHLGALTFSRRPFLVGLVHGLAGSGAVAALALASLPTQPARLIYVLLFGAGSVGGMALLTALYALGLGRITLGRTARAGVLLASGALSAIVGVAHGWEPLARLLG